MLAECTIAHLSGMRRVRTDADQACLADTRLHIGAAHKAYGRRVVLRGADLTVSAGCSPA
ncbi:hypothetical protein GCM10010252_26350 [Streptomyces aureoverticillatus]|nr:hypothetical protein GCM10010252_26350 [Streptomyces aureoverticillatus]